MEYERIHKPQSGLISPSKLRMKLMGSHNHKSNNSSSRTSPSKLEDAEFVMNSLLSTADFDEEVSSFEVNSGVDSGDRSSGKSGKVKLQQVLKGETGNSSSVHPIRAVEDENLDYDSNASSSSFEFHQGEQRSNQNHIARSLLRPMSSKWNDAEKWIMNKQNAKANYSKKNGLQSQTDRVPGKIVPELSVKRVDFCEPSDQLGFDFDHPAQSKVMIEVENKDISSTVEDSTGGLGIRAVEMRDMGTEMTPIPSQEPSRTSTPLCATTPLRSPTSSIPSTPRRGAGHDDVEPRNENENGNMELSDQDLKLKTRREIVALGVQLGKKNITAWASQDDKTEAVADAEELRMVEFDKRAAAWEEAEKSKHTARFKREEIKIQAWESRQKAELEAETRQIEAQMEEMRARAHAKMVKKIAMAKQRSEEKRAAAEARKTREAERTAARAEYIRQTGKIPSSSYICCAWT